MKRNMKKRDPTWTYPYVIRHEFDLSRSKIELVCAYILALGGIPRAENVRNIAKTEFKEYGTKGFLGGEDSWKKIEILAKEHGVPFEGLEEMAYSEAQLVIKEFEARKKPGKRSNRLSPI
jgi:hypothetical protein